MPVLSPQQGSDSTQRSRGESSEITLGAACESEGGIKTYSIVVTMITTEINTESWFLGRNSRRINSQTGPLAVCQITRPLSKISYASPFYFPFLYSLYVATMQVTKVALLALFGLTSAVPTRRSVSDVESSISSISSALTTVDGDVVAFTGSFLQALPLLTAVNNLESDITSGTSAITSTGTLSLDDSNTILSSVTGLSSQIEQVLTDLEAKVHNLHAQYVIVLAANLSQASVVASAGYTSVVSSALGTLQSDADAFFKALEGTSELSKLSIQTKGVVLTDMSQSTLLLPPRSPLCRLRLIRNLLPPSLTSKPCASKVSPGRNIKNACIMSLSV